MQGYKEYFAGKRVTLMGLGLLGRGVGDAEFLAPLVKELVVTDLKTEEQLAESIARLKKFPNVIFHVGGHAVEDFKDRDLVIKAAGVPLDSSYIREAKKNNIPVRMSADLFMELSSVPIVGVTGTRGKSTVTHLIAYILASAGKKVLLGGNVRGVSTLALLDKVTPDAIGVLELDSWQMQGFGDAKMSPQVAVFTTFFPDHMNYYKNDMEAYFADKANIFLNQTPEDTFILGEQVAPFVKEYGYEKKVAAHTEMAGSKNVPKQWQLKIVGEHNRYNAGLAIAAADALGADMESIEEAVKAFPGVEGRLEFMGEKNGVKIYNDNNSTTPEATIVALEALDEGKKNIILIMGGADKGLDMSALQTAVHAYVKNVLFLAGTGTDKVRDSEPMFNSIQEAVAAAIAVAAPGDTILFSPAFASFGMFKNEYDRNDQFKAAVQALI